MTAAQSMYFQVEGKLGGSLDAERHGWLVLLLQPRMSRSANGEEGIARADAKGYHVIPRVRTLCR